MLDRKWPESYRDLGRTVPLGQQLTEPETVALRSGEVFTVLGEDGEPHSWLLMDPYGTIREREFTAAGEAGGPRRTELAETCFKLLRPSLNPFDSARGFCQGIHQCASRFGIGEVYATYEEALAIADREVAKLTVDYPGTFGVIQLMETAAVRSPAFAVLAFYSGGERLWTLKEEVVQEWLRISRQNARDGDLNYYPPEETAAEAV